MQTTTCQHFQITSLLSNCCTLVIAEQNVTSSPNLYQCASYGDHSYPSWYCWVRTCDNTQLKSAVSFHIWAADEVELPQSTHTLQLCAQSHFRPKSKSTSDLIFLLILLWEGIQVCVLEGISVDACGAQIPAYHHLCSCAVLTTASAMRAAGGAGHTAPITLLLQLRHWKGWGHSSCHTVPLCPQSRTAVHSISPTTVLLSTSTLLGRRLQPSSPKCSRTQEKLGGSAVLVGPGF